jgi:hypothetical protein
LSEISLFQEEFLPYDACPLSQLLFTTVPLADQRGKAIGTGFFYAIRGVCYLITCKHIIESKRVQEIHFPAQATVTIKGQQQPSNVLFDITKKIASGGLTYHPTEDLVAISLVGVDEAALDPRFAGIKPSMFFKCFTKDCVKDQKELQKCKVLKNIEMLAYPKWFTNNHNQFPIIRTGTIATLPSLDFNGKKRGLINIYNYPGDSGSPILVVNYERRDYAKGKNNGGSRLILLGILAHRIMEKGDKQCSKGNDLQAEKKLFFLQEEPLHLGLYIKSECLLYFDKNCQ